jgi:hypothetical protein
MALMLVELAPTISVLLAMHVLALIADYVWLRRAPRPRGLLFLALEAALFLPTPLLFPVDAIVVRFFFAILAALKVVRCAELAFGKVHDPAMLDTFPRFVIWASTGADTAWPRSQGDARQNRRAGLLLAFEAAGYVAADALLVWGLTLFPGWTEATLSRSLVMLLVMGFTVPAMTALTTLGASLLGYRVEPVMRHPLVAGSLSEFWGRRWNRSFRDLAYRLVYRPLRDRGVSIGAATLVVFAASASAHEYLVGLSTQSDFGWMSAFFLLQGALTLAGRRLTALLPERLRPLCGRLWLWCALIATAPLFFMPFTKIIDIVGISRWLQALLPL